MLKLFSAEVYRANVDVVTRAEQIEKMMKSHFGTCDLFLIAVLLAHGIHGIASPKSRSVAVTFDDLPAVALSTGDCNLVGLLELNGRLLKQIETHRVPVTGLVKEGGICDHLREEHLCGYIYPGVSLLSSSSSSW